MPNNDRHFEVKIIRRYCKGCGLCVGVCPQGKIGVEPLPDEEGVRHACLRPDIICLGCKQCALMCPDAAIEIVEHRTAAAPKGARTKGAAPARKDSP